MKNLLEEIREAPLLSVHTQETLRAALRCEGKEHLLDLFLSNDRRTGLNRQREALPGAGEVFHKACRFFNRATTKEEKSFISGTEKAGEAYVRYWEDSEGRFDSATMVIGYAEGEGQKREWALRVSKKRGFGLLKGGRLVLNTYLNGKLHDGTSGFAAEHDFTLHEGVEVATLFNKKHRIHGLLWSPGENDPAVVVYYEKGGVVRYEKFFRNGSYMRRKDGKPNYIQYWESGAKRVEQWRKSAEAYVRENGSASSEFSFELHRPRKEGPMEIHYDMRGRVVGRSYAEEDTKAGYVDMEEESGLLLKKGDAVNAIREVLRREEMALEGVKPPPGGGNHILRTLTGKTGIIGKCGAGSKGGRTV